MHRHLVRFIVIVSVAMAIAVPAAAQEASNSGIDSQYTWDLNELYATPADWDAARQKALAGLEKIEARRGTLGDSADSLFETLALISAAQKDASRVYTYASLSADEDLRVTETQERRQLGQIMLSRFSEATAWVQPELLAVGAEVINAYIAEDERLAPFAYQLDDALRNAPYTLGEEAEETLAYFSQAFSSRTTSTALSQTPTSPGRRSSSRAAKAIGLIHRATAAGAPATTAMIASSCSTRSGPSGRSIATASVPS